MPTQAVHTLSKSAALDFVELRSARHSNSCYSSHSHDEFSFGVVDQGSAHYKNLQQFYSIHPGTTVTINPGDAHSCNAQQVQWSYRMLFVDTQWVGELQREIHLHNQQDFMPFEQHLLESTTRYNRFSCLYDCLLNDPSALKAEEMLIEYLVEIFDSPLKQPNLQVDKISLVRELIMDKLGANLSLANFCHLANLSPYHLIRSFKHRYGQSPHAYQLDQRIKHAKKRLQAGDSLVHTAHALGFADQSHFQRNFKKRTALTPRQYQRFFV
jgi:AraC-like DNA-binding protein